jgi:hypothetical protein
VPVQLACEPETLQVWVVVIIKPLVQPYKPLRDTHTLRWENIIAAWALGCPMADDSTASLISIVICMVGEDDPSITITTDEKVRCKFRNLKTMAD